MTLFGEGDTIAAIATAVGGGIGVIRVSGPEALALARQHFDGLPDRPQPRHLYHGWWLSGTGAPLDEGLLAFMPGPRSYTGEDVVEVHLHGGALNLRRCLQVCWDAGIRPAGPGEFTRRAFLNGRLSLDQAEAVADLIHAEDELAASAALELAPGTHPISLSFFTLRSEPKLELELTRNDGGPPAGAA